ncbi:MAG: hypothetical protein COA33_000095 [Fluviicola sp.]|nr:hypothetical protein [Fluviicola sp.]
MRHSLLLFLVFAFAPFSLLFSQVTIKGFAPSYVGETIEAYRILDYFSNKKEKITSATVESDSSFTLYLASDITQKIILKSKNNRGFLLVQPKGKYSIFFPEKDKFSPNRPNGNQVEVAFYNLDSTDINYKVLGFQRWADHFLGNNYHKKSLNNNEFSESLDAFKTRVEKAYKNDTSSYFKTHVRFTMAGLDNIPNAAERNRYEKHDFYIKNSPVSYNNETYILYIKEFYQKLMPRLPNKTNEAVYEGIIKSSPTIIMKALGTEYTLKNLRIRELIMINTLAEVYNSGEYPKTNLATILDSLSTRTMFKANRIVAINLLDRITALVPGSKAPDFVLTAPELEIKTLYNFQKKHLYIHFFDPAREDGVKELPLLVDLQIKYGNYVQFITVTKERKNFSDKEQSFINSIPWEVYTLPSSNSIWKNYSIETFPQYTLIDAAGYIVASPALGPTPNGQYETIDKTFFYLKKSLEKE